MGRHRTLAQFNTLFTMQANGCWTWNAATPGNYGSYGVQAHRYAYRTMVGPIPEGLEIDHLCRNPSCVNPHHLQPVTKEMNHLRALWAKGYTSQPSKDDIFDTDEVHARVLAISPIFRHMDDKGIVRSKIAARYGISKQVLLHIERGHCRAPHGFVKWMIGFMHMPDDVISPEARELVERQEKGA